MCFYISTEVSIYVYEGNLPVILCDLMPLFCDMTVIYAARMLALIRKIVDFWLEEINICHNMTLNSNICELHDIWKVVEGAFYNLSKAYEAFQRVFAVPVSFSLLKMFCFLFR